MKKEIGYYAVKGSDSLYYEMASIYKQAMKDVKPEDLLLNELSSQPKSKQGLESDLLQGIENLLVYKFDFEE